MGMGDVKGYYVARDIGMKESMYYRCEQHWPDKSATKNSSICSTKSVVRVVVKS